MFLSRLERNFPQYLPKVQRSLASILRFYDTRRVLILINFALINISQIVAHRSSPISASVKLS